MENFKSNSLLKNTMTPKQARMAQIVTCIADHYHVPATHIIDLQLRKGKSVMSARRLLVYHLYDCGMSLEKIASFLKRDVHTVRDYYTDGKRIVLNGKRDFVDELPRVTSTLQITNK